MHTNFFVIKILIFVVFLEFVCYANIIEFRIQRFKVKNEYYILAL